MVSEDSINRFGGVARLYGMDGLKKIINAHACVIGIGGVGSWAVESLARSGIGKLTLIDLDEICITNINRQLHAMEGEIGKQKTDAMEQRIRAINPHCIVENKQMFYHEKNAEQLLSAGFDFIIDAIDHVKAKVHLISSCKQLNIPLVVCGGAGGLRNPTLMEVADMSQVYNDALLKQVRTRLRAEHGFPKGEITQVTKKPATAEKKLKEKKPKAKKKKKAKKFGVECIFSSESPQFPQCDGSVAAQRGEDKDTKLNCATGFGSITHVTATMGLIAAERCLHFLTTADSLKS